jgi:hypothetical protein
MQMIDAIYKSADSGKSLDLKKPPMDPPAPAT